jgi:hypothetical protein
MNSTVQQYIEDLQKDLVEKTQQILHQTEQIRKLENEKNITMPHKDRRIFEFYTKIVRTLMSDKWYLENGKRRADDIGRKKRIEWGHHFEEIIRTGK